MVDKNSKNKIRHLSKGQRTHVRRLKQAASKDAGISIPQSGPVRPVRVHKNKTNPEEVA